MFCCANNDKPFGLTRREWEREGVQVWDSEDELMKKRQNESVLLPISIFFKLIEAAGSARVSFLYNKLNKFISTNLFFPQTNMPCRHKKRG